ncbi:MAG TPA: hypothetical protein VMS73_02595 [Anaerolineaceae bacterium]|nr:hypothetical protein [Anaerolineaceae bacterium]
MIYELKVLGELDQSWSDWLGSIHMVVEKQEDGPIMTILTAEVADQSALFGILDRIRDLNLVLVSINVD